ncbi:hypothetical protein [Natronobeatus ordinarius]|uniref:hypothetical protein n=1 Tax=Natronobeatus ordinarius TaxID=2963433 RepID=UPI0020CE74DA|nr:hypothetical protein [Natronobeatus ordinarius]
MSEWRPRRRAQAVFGLALASLAVVVGILAVVDRTGAFALLYLIAIAAIAAGAILSLIGRRRPDGK